MRAVRPLALLLVGAGVLVLLGSMVAGLASGSGPRGDGGPGGAPESGPEERVRVEVLNAAGVPGLARAATDRLRSAGFDVVYYGNAPTFGRDTSVVLDRLGKPGVARDVARAADIPLVQERRDTSLYLEATVILGRDWSGIPQEPDSVRP